MSSFLRQMKPDADAEMYLLRILLVSILSSSGRKGEQWGGGARLSSLCCRKIGEQGDKISYETCCRCMDGVKRTEKTR